MAPPGSRRTLVSRWSVGIFVSFQIYDQLDGVVIGVTRDAQLVDHVLDQEQSPAAGTLYALQLGLQVRCLRVRARWRTTTPVDDAHQETLPKKVYLDLDRDFGGVPVAVLHGIHSRLGYGSFELLQALLRQPQPAHDGGHLLHRQAFVAGLAGNAEVSQGTSGTAPWSRHRSSNLSRVTSVMSSSCSQLSLVKRLNMTHFPDVR